MRTNILQNALPTELTSILRRWPLFLASTSMIYHGVATQSVPQPSLDLSSLGRVGLAGDFDAISVYTHQGQSERPTTDGRQSILTPLPNGDLASLASADAHITTMCPFVMKNGDLLGVVVGGNFTSLGGEDAQAVALFNPSSSNVTALPGVQGTVSALFCDQDTNSVYVGGSFKAANSTNAIAWVGTAGWTNLPFAGFNGPVTSITKASSGHIVFGGSFGGLGNTTTPATKDSQIINLSTAKITAEPPSDNTDPDIHNPRNIVCPPNSTDAPDQGGANQASRTWLMPDNKPSFWQADMAFGFIPSKLRLWNTNQDGRGTRIFRFTDLPDRGILNLTYIDPSSGKRVYCDQRCELNHNSSNPYQDFTFVNPVGMNGFRIDVSEWYGAGGGFNGIQLFEDEIWAYAVNDFNEPSCANLPTGSNSTATGPWRNTPAGPGGQADYLTTDVDQGTTDPASVVFKPDIKQSGNYTITVYTPGCQRDGTCGSRGLVNITADLGSSGTEVSRAQPTATIFQTNTFDKYDQVFMSYVAAGSDAFRPTVTLTPVPGQGRTVAVAARVKFELIDSTGGLNGLFEYDPNQAVVDMDFSKSAINRAGTELKPGAQVASLVASGDAIFAGGQFSDDVFENIMLFRDNNASSFEDGGLNDAVSSLYALDDLLYFGGRFTDAANARVDGLSHVAAWSLSQNQWVALGAGVDGPVDTVVPFQVNVTSEKTEIAIAFSGSFGRTLAFGSSPASSADGFAVWVPSQKNWLQNLNVEKLVLDGQLSASATLKNGTQLLAGTLESRGQAISGAVLLESSKTSTLRSLGVNIQPSQQQSSLQRRTLTNTQDVNGVIAGLFFNRNDLNVTVLAGHFAATATNGSTVNNLVFSNASQNNDVTGLSSGIDPNATFTTLDTHENILFAGGVLSGQVAGADVEGVISYDLSVGAFGANQPPALSGRNVTVNAIATRPNSREVYVGGSFDNAGSLGCPSVCVFDTSSNAWNRPGLGIGGVVSSLAWTSNTNLIVAGDLTVNGNKTSIATYDTKKTKWTAMFTGSIPGPVNAFTLETSDGSRFWVSGRTPDGSTFLMQKDGKRFKAAGNGTLFGENTDLRGLQVLSLSDSHRDTDLLDGNQVLLATGRLNFTNFGYVSAALFNGTDFSPFILSVTSSGDPGSLSQLWSQNKNSLPGSHRGHSKGIVILVALCAALGCIFLIIAIGIILDKIQRRRAGYTSIPSSYTDKQSNIGRVPPQHLFSQLGRGDQAPTI